MIRPREPVILAEHFDRLVTWYVDVLGFEVTRRFEGAFHYVNLATPTGIRLGIAPAAEMGIVPGERSNNTVFLQIEVENVADFLEHVRGHGATTTGPDYDEGGGFWFGGFTDVEGNPVWVVDANCP